MVMMVGQVDYDHLLVHGQIIKFDNSTTLSFDYKNIKQPLEISSQSVMTTLGSIDQAGYNWLKPPIKTGGGFDRPTLVAHGKGLLS